MVAHKRSDGESKTTNKIFDNLFIPATTGLADDIGLTQNERDALVEQLRGDQQKALVPTTVHDEGVVYVDEDVAVMSIDLDAFHLSKINQVDDPRYKDNELMALVHNLVAAEVTGQEDIAWGENMFVYCIDFEGGL